MTIPDPRTLLRVLSPSAGFVTGADSARHARNPGVTVTFSQRATAGHHSTGAYITVGGKG